MFSFGRVPISGQKRFLKRKGTALLSWKRTTASRLPCYFHHYNPQNNWLNNLLVGWLTDTQLPCGTQLCFVCLGPCTSFYLHHSHFLSASFTFPPSAPWPYLVFSFFVRILFIPLAQSLLPYFSSTLLVLFLSDFFIVGLCHHSSWELHTACYFIRVSNIGFFCRLTTVTVYKHTK